MKEPDLYQFSVFEQWTLYDRIVRNNYMKHDEISKSISDAIRHVSNTRQVWDLGCGCGLMALKILKTLQVESYLGIDLADSGLSRVSASLFGVVGEIETRNAELTSFLKETHEWSPSLILASFSLHHFQFDEMAEVLGLIRDQMDENCHLIWVDPQRKSHESREEFIRRFMFDVASTWEDLEPSEVLQVEEHMLSSDFPLDASEQDSLLTKIGFSTISECYRDSFFSAKVLTKS
jgi:predicted TPR repeat methyltransferase